MNLLPEGMAIYELRGKRGRKHIVFYRYISLDHAGTTFAGPYPRGLCRWYSRRRGQRWTAVGDWFSYYPEPDS